MGQVAAQFGPIVAHGPLFARGPLSSRRECGRSEGHCAEESAHLRLRDSGLDGELAFGCQGAQMDVLLDQHFFCAPKWMDEISFEIELAEANLELTHATGNWHAGAVLSTTRFSMEQKKRSTLFEKSLRQVRELH